MKIKRFNQLNEDSNNNDKILKKDIPDDMINKISELFIKLTNGEITDKEYIEKIKKLNK